MKKFLLFLMLSFGLNTSGQIVDTLIDFNSLASVIIQAKKGEKELWYGTGFFIKVKSTNYLITNNHVVGGKCHTDDFKRRRNNDGKKDTLPDVISVRIFDKNLGAFKFESLGLDDVKGNLLYTKFYENEKDENTLLDVVAIPIKGLNSIHGNVTVNGYDSTSIGGIQLYNSQQLFVVGYPEKTDNFYPIWKSGTIASEPNFIYVGNSTFYIDATTRGGMSGSPVVFRDNKILRADGNLDFLSGLVTKLIGIYSAQNYNSELGVVTRIETIYKKLYAISN